jgi:hypothetical protein
MLGIDAAGDRSLLLQLHVMTIRASERRAGARAATTFTRPVQRP